jgi:hypothetical protein
VAAAVAWFQLVRLNEADEQDDERKREKREPVDYRKINDGSISAHECQWGRENRST